jgi:hypothetical protein
MAECAAADVQDLREQITRLQLKGKKLDFLMANMHFLEKNPELGEVVMDTETFDAALVKCMKEAGQ